MLLSISFLAGCNLEDLINNQDGDPENVQNNGEGDNGNNNEPQDEIADVKEDYDTKEIDNKLDGLRLQNGFFIKYEYQSSDEAETTVVAYGAKDLCSMYDSVTEEDFVKTSDIIAVRSYDKYTTVVIDGILVKHTICVDKETGICLKWEVEAVTTSGSSFVRFECKEFKTNYDIAIPTVSNED